MPQVLAHSHASFSKSIINDVVTAWTPVFADTGAIIFRSENSSYLWNSSKGITEWFDEYENIHKNNTWNQLLWPLYSWTHKAGVVVFV